MGMQYAVSTRRYKNTWQCKFDLPNKMSHPLYVANAYWYLWHVGIHILKNFNMILCIVLSCHQYQSRYTKTWYSAVCSLHETEQYLDAKKLLENLLKETEAGLILPVLYDDQWIWSSTWSVDTRTDRLLLNESRRNCDKELDIFLVAQVSMGCETVSHRDTRDLMDPFRDVLQPEKLDRDQVQFFALKYALATHSIADEKQILLLNLSLFCSLRCCRH